jgi:ATP-dependent Zn protease
MLLAVMKKQEVVEIVDFLKDPSKFKRLVQPFHVVC